MDVSYGKGFEVAPTAANKPQALGKSTSSTSNMSDNDNKQRKGVENALGATNPDETPGKSTST